MQDVNWIAHTSFIALFGFVIWLGFAGRSLAQEDDLDLLHEWGLGGRRFGTIIKTNGKADSDDFMGAVRGMSWESPRGPMTIDPQTRDTTISRFQDSLAVFNREPNSRHGPAHGRRLAFLRSANGTRD